jgi:hypothetical protein
VYQQTGLCPDTHAQKAGPGLQVKQCAPLLTCGVLCRVVPCRVVQVLFNVLTIGNVVLWVDSLLVPQLLL